MVAFRSYWKRSVLRSLAALLVLFAAAFELQAAVEAELDRARIVEGETVTLTIATTDARRSLDPDLAPLDADFEILDRRSETQLSIVDGRQTALVRLLITLEPRRAGDLLIPALDFGDEKTSPIGLRVDPAPELDSGELPPVFIEVELTPEQGPYYVHAQFGLVIRVFYQQNLTEAAISPPEPEPASVRLLQETPYQAERGGERYRVLERRYAIFPERSGELVIPAMQLTGRLVERRDSTIWQPSVRGRRIRVESDALEIPIAPRPTAFTGLDWQPARELTLGQQVSTGDLLRVGEPVTRTVIIDAVGLEENMIAEPEWPAMENARIYPDQPQGITRDNGRWVLGHKEFRYAVVPEQEGELILPELRVEWWDTAANQQRTAVLPAKTLTVQPSALVPPVAAPAEAPETAASTEPTISETAPGYWRWLALLFAALWLATLALAWRLRGKSVAKTDNDAVIDADEAELMKHIRGACRSNDRAGARRFLLQWLRRFRAGDGSLRDFADAVDEPALRDSLHALDSDGFRPDGKELWDGRAFWPLFEKWRMAPVGGNGGSPPDPTDLYAPENRQA
ncbi:MAG: protein BatD [Xanthomonadales bacterium]|nr:protein BatD [Xanthomonadales bacterium]